MKPRIRINADGHPTVMKAPPDWFKSNQFSLTILRCWIEFLKDNKPK